MNLTVAGTGVHTVTYTLTNSFGCAGTGTKTVVVTAVPTITFAPITPVCQSGNNLVLNFASPQGGNYSGNGVQFGIFNPATAGVGQHVIRYTTGVVGCQATDSVIITVFATPQANIERVNDTLRAIRPAAAYQWFNNRILIPGETNRSFVPLVNGVYQLVVDSAACSSALSADYNFFMTSLDEVQLQQIRVYPNPAEDGRFMLVLPSEQGTSIEVTDLHGRFIFSRVTSSMESLIDLSTEASGMYLLRWVTAEQSGVLRLIRK
jgi:hypothetical protein